MIGYNRAVLALLTASALSAQSFEAASVKRYTPHVRAAESAPNIIDLYRPIAATRIEYVHLSLKSILAIAYGVGKDQITGPPWLASEYYDVVARLPPGALSSQVPPMLQSLVMERFSVALHHETTQRKGFALVATTGSPELAAAHAGSRQIFDGVSGSYRFTNFTVTELAHLLSIFLGRPIADQTGIQGNYDISLKVYGADLALAGKLGDNSLRSVNDALRPLGLKLESRTVPADIIVVEKADPAPLRE